MCIDTGGRSGPRNANSGTSPGGGTYNLLHPELPEFTPRTLNPKPQTPNFQTLKPESFSPET